MDYAQLGKDTVTIILVALAVWLFLRLCTYAVSESVKAEARAEEIHDLEALLGIAEYLEKREREQQHVHEPPDEPFALDETDLTFQLRRSIEIAEESGPHAA